MVEKTLQWVVWSAMTLLVLRGNYSLLKKHGLRGTLGGYTRLRWIDLILAVPVGAAVIGSVFLMVSHSSILAWGWWNAVGGTGNPSLSANNMMPTFIRIPFQIFMITFAVVVLPVMAELEEDIFRKGSEHRGPWKRFVAAFLFGMVHCLIGVPIGAGIAITVAGLYYTAAYLREYKRTENQVLALAASSRAHLAYNVVVITVLLVAILGIPAYHHVSR
jgi:hypothetical protein